MGLHLFAIVQGFCAVFALAFAAVAVFAAGSAVQAVLAQIAARPPAPATPRPPLRLVRTEAKPAPEPEARENDPEWLKEFG